MNCDGRIIKFEECPKLFKVIFKSQYLEREWDDEENEGARNA